VPFVALVPWLVVGLTHNRRVGRQSEPRVVH
jgi:hypothetical protein